ncbi:MAG: sulfite exporter TauE/SafE family protein [Candidatus Latescibacterota bacterium]|nr:MAG: sulfite exporter TauE/SafE family protein [Candidatus Latescibacterota bacterium]
MDTLGALDLAIAAAAAVAAGAVNALAGGGTLITFPVLTAIGLPAVAANVTNTVALSPGYLGGTLAQARDLRGQGRRLAALLPVGVAGGIVGAALLLVSGEKLFRALVPFLILGASLLLAAHERVRAFLGRRSGKGGGASPGASAAAPAFAASIYGGYFGAGLSVILLAVLALAIDETLTRLNALKQAIALAVNAAAAVFFLFSGHVVWSAALVMAAGALAGGALGGRLAGRVSGASLRRVVVVIGIAVAVIYWTR